MSFVYSEIWFVTIANQSAWMHRVSVTHTKYLNYLVLLIRMPSLIDSFTCTLSMSTLTRHLLKHQQKNSMDHVLIISYANANECCLSGAHKFILIWRTLCLVCSSTQSIHKITALTHKQIQFELYYFHYNICLHTDAIYVLLWNVAVALGSEQPREYIHTHAHRTSLESKPFADGVCVSICAWVWT